MKIAIFSDIHGNIFAFEQIYRQIKKENCDLHLFLGDICGYYYHQNEVIEILKTIPNLFSIAGNHDLLFLKSLDNAKVMTEYSKTYGRSFEFLKASITPPNLEFLKQLSPEFILPRLDLAAFHGSPWNPVSQYVYPDSLTERFDELPYKVVFLGHTHYTMDIHREHMRIINPGSVGQPRDGGWPSYALYNTENDQLAFKRVQYDVDAQVADILGREDANSYLIEVLMRMGEKI